MAEYIASGNWLFRWRSYPPLVVLAMVATAVALRPVPIGGANWSTAWTAAGLALGFVGLAIRAWALGYVPRGTSGRGTERPTATSLNTTGLYSVVRHPLYLGNLFLWLGVAAVGGRLLPLVVTGLAFWLYYERIMMAEERFLYGRFGVDFARWAARTPAFVPRPAGWIPSDQGFSLRFCLGRDYHAFYGFVASVTVVAVVRAARTPPAGPLPGPGWLAFFGIGTLVFAVLHGLKRRTRLLEVDGR